MLALSEAKDDLASAETFPSWVQPLPSWTQDAREAGDVRWHQEEDGWRRSDDIWLSDFASEVLKRVPVAAVMQSPARDRYVESLEGFVDWTLDTINPAWRTEQRHGRGRDGSNQFQWQRQLGRLVQNRSGDSTMSVPSRVPMVKDTAKSALVSPTMT